jgi:VanZ family protein
VRTRSRDIFVAWAPAIAWAAVIFYMSTDELSAEHTRGWIEPIVRFFLPTLSDDVFELFHAAVRKLAHVTEYFVFALLIERGCRRASALAPSRTPLVAWASAALYSLTDEGHQLFVASRGASLVDCVLDSIGAAVAAFMASRGIRLR